MLKMEAELTTPVNTYRFARCQMSKTSHRLPVRCMYPRMPRPKPYRFQNSVWLRREICITKRILVRGNAEEVEMLWDCAIFMYGYLRMISFERIKHKSIITSISAFR